MNTIYPHPISFLTQPGTSVGREGLRLLPGQLVPALVVDSKPGGTLILEINGNLLEAYTNVPLAVGEKVSLEAQDLKKEGKWSFKVLNAALPNDANTDLNDLLVRLGFPKSEAVKAVARALLEFGMPVTKENIANVQRSLSILGGEQEEQLHQAVFLQKAGLSESKEALSLFKTFWAQTGEIAPALRDLLNLLATGMEEAELKSNPAQVLLPALDPRPAAETLSDLKMLISTLKQILTIIPQPAAKTNVEGLTHYINAWLTDGTRLPDLLIRIDQAIAQNASLATWTKEMRAALHQALQTMTTELYGQHVLNTVDKSRLDQPNYYYFAIPLPFIEENAQGELRIYKRDKKQKKLSLTDLRVVFYLETPYLGKNRFDLHFLPPEIRFRILVEQGEIGELITQYWPELATRLEKIGFYPLLKECGTGEPKSLRPAPEPLTDLSQKPRIDLKV